MLIRPTPANPMRDRPHARLLLAACIALSIASSANTAPAERPAGATTPPAARSSGSTDTPATTAAPAETTSPGEKTPAGNTPGKGKSTPATPERRGRSPDVFVPSEAVPEDRPLAFPVDI